MALTSEVWNNFKIRQGTREPGAFRIGAGGGASVLTGVIPSADLDTILQEGVESAVADNSTGQINRILPVASPRWPWHFLRSVDNAVGVSFVEKVEADPDGILEAPSLPFWADYQEYEVQLAFEPRPYPVLDDLTVPKNSLSYYLDNDNGMVAATVRDVWYEWWRWTHWYAQPSAEYLTADLGQFLFWNPGGAGDKTTGPSTGSSAGTGQLRLLVPSMAWRVVWEMVPHQYVLSNNSFITKAIGRVNQKAWEGFAPGQALLQAVNTTRVYPSPFPGFTTYDGFNVVSQDKLCDLELVIIDALDRTAATSVTPTNRSYIASGHNVAPYQATGKYYYAEQILTNGGAAGTGVPAYLSYPFELIFQNPEWVP